jgi:hypothetical protein
MTENIKISCINRRTRTDPHQRISHVGGIHDRRRWRLSLDAAIQSVKDGSCRYYTTVDDVGVWVVVATHKGHLYLKTQNDGFQPDNLLALPTCPSA